MQNHTSTWVDEAYLYTSSVTKCLSHDNLRSGVDGE